MSLADIQSMKALKTAKQISNRYMLQATELFDSNYQVSPNITDNYYLDNTGNLNALSTYAVSSYIPISPNTIHIINQAVNAQSLFGCWYDVNRTFIRGFNGITDISPSNAVYARININKTLTQTNYSFTANTSIIDNWHGKKANFLGDSITFGFNGTGNPAFSNPYPSLVGQMLELATVNNYGISGTSIQSYSGDPTYKDQSFTKRFPSMDNSADLIFVFGGTNDFGHNLPLGNPGTYEIDTFTINAGATVSGNITITLNGVGTVVAVTAGDSASTVATKIANTLFNQWHSIANGNVITFTKGLMGTNTSPSFSDTGTTGVTASITVTTTGVNQDTVDGTFYGALNVLMSGLIQKYPHKTIVFATPLHRIYQDSGQFQQGEINKSGFKLLDYVNAMKTVAQQYGIPVLDLYSNSGFNPLQPSLNSLYTIDGLHPNQTGHNLIASKIARFLRTV